MRGLNGALSSDSAQSLFARLVLQELSSGVLGWAAVMKTEQAYCGHVFLGNHSRDERSIEIGFVLSKSFHRRGFATEMAAAVRDYARLQLGCKIVRATVDEDNVRSRTVLARIGMSVASRRHDDSGAYLVYQDEAEE